jgi:alanine dehydrogenase
MRLLRDRDLEKLVDPARAVERVEVGYRADARGDVFLFPRTRYEARDVSLAWLGAAIPSEDVMGYRSYAYNAEGYDRGEQLVVLYGYRAMDVRAVFVGRVVGNLRTGAALAAALHLAEPGVSDLGLLGTGEQARNALACVCAVARPSRVVAWSPHPERRVAFRDWAERALGLRPELAADAAEVVRRSSAVVLATSAEQTVVTAEMVPEPRLLLSIAAYRRPEIDAALFDAAPIVWTDSVAQAGAPGTLFDSPGRRGKLRPLGQGVLDGSLRDRTATRIVLNTGAAWQELVVGQALLERAESSGAGVSIDLPAERPRASIF